MSIYQDGITLAHQELIALLALGGKTKYYGYVQPDKDYTEKQIWDICCDLVAAGMMVVQDDRFQMREDLFRVIVPLLEAEYALVLRAGKMEPEAIYYFGDEIVAVEPAISGYSLCALEWDEFCEDVMGRSCIHFYDLDYPVKTTPDVEPVNDPIHVEHLVQQRDFLLSWIEMDSGETLGCLCGWHEGIADWLERTGKEASGPVLLTRENLKDELTKLTKVEST